MGTSWVKNIWDWNAGSLIAREGVIRTTGLGDKHLEISKLVFGSCYGWIRNLNTATRSDKISVKFRRSQFSFQLVEKAHICEMQGLFKNWGEHERHKGYILSQSFKSGGGGMDHILEEDSCLVLFCFYKIN